MTRNTILSLSAALIGLFMTTASCKKDGESLTPSPGIAASPTFVGPRWQMREFLLSPAVDFDGDGKLDQDLLPFMPSCDRDNSMTFESTGKISLSEGAIQCDSDEPTSNGKPEAWSYNKTTKTIIITKNDQAGSVSTWEVLESSAKVLTIKTTVTEGGKSLNATLHWKAI